jgi:hypothetical protein
LDGPKSPPRFQSRRNYFLIGNFSPVKLILELEWDCLTSGKNWKIGLTGIEQEKLVEAGKVEFKAMYRSYTVP